MNSFSLLFVVISSLVAVSQARLVLNGKVAGNAKLDDPIQLEVLGLPVNLDGSAKASAQGSALVGRRHHLSKKNTAKKVVLQDSLEEEPVELEVVEVAPANSEEEGAIIMRKSRFNGEKSNGKLVIKGTAGAGAELVEPIDVEILGLPVSLTGGANGDVQDLHNETLATLKNPAASSESSKQISFNKYSLGELRSTVCKEHIQVHKRDLRLNLKCHKFTHETCSIDYTKGAYIISPLRIYSILYIALLVKRDVIHLGDLLRFLREGYLNCNRFSSLFPDSYADKILNIQDNSIKGIYSHTVFRSTASKMIEFLEIQDYIVCPDLSILAERYCSELNLPDEVVNMVQHILLENPIKFSGTIPNYEGRVMSVIIFVLKILFGLDGVTERHFSKYAQQCNRIVSESRMFDIINWLEFIEYRKLVISENHLPTSHLHDNEINLNPDLFLQYKYTHNIFVSDRNRIVSDMVGYKNLLSRIQNLQQDYIPAIEFLPNLTPFKNYSDIIAPSKMSQNIKLILNRNFRRDSLGFLLRSKQYFDDFTLFHDEGANKNYKLEHMKTHHECAYFIEPKNKKFVPVRLLDNSDGSSGSEEVEDDRSFAKYASSISSENEAAYNRHYHPHKRHWLYLRGRIEMASKEKFEEFFSKHSVGFRTIVRECCRVIEESPAELLSQLQHTELYLIYCGNFSNSIERRHASKLGPYLRQAESNW